jgi:hypothetical protein
MFSLMSALGASLAKGCVSEFSLAGSTWSDARKHCRRFRGFKRWHLKLIVQCLPILLHIAFFLFSIGLVSLVLQADTAIGVVILALTAIIVFLYVGSSIHPVYSLDSPFRTPVSGMIRRLLNGPWRLDGFTSFPSWKEAQKAQALAWLLIESPNADTINAAIRAIAGLPANPVVQDELLHPSIAGLLSRTLSDEFAKASPDQDALSACLYAMLHLVQAAPSDPGDTIAPTILRALLNADGPLSVTDSMPGGIREIAVCVKARILLFLFDDLPRSSVFDTELPWLLKSCRDKHLRRLLFEISLLVGPPGKPENVSVPDDSPYNYRDILRGRTVAHNHSDRWDLSRRRLRAPPSTLGNAAYIQLTMLEGSGQYVFARSS